MMALCRLDQKRKLKTFEMAVLQKICGITRKDQRRNVKLKIIKNINEILQTPLTLDTCLVWKRRPMKKWLDNIREDCKDLNQTVH